MIEVGIRTRPERLKVTEITPNRCLDTPRLHGELTAMAEQEFDW